MDGSRGVTDASNAIMSGWRQVPSVNSTAWQERPHCGHWESPTGPEAQAQIDSLAFEVDVATHHAPRRLKLQRKLEQLLHAPDRHAVGQHQAWYPPDSGEPGREPPFAHDRQARYPLL